MSNDSSNSLTETTSKTKNELEQLQKELSDKGVDIEKLAVLMVAGNEQFIGEFYGHVDAGDFGMRQPDPNLLVGVPVQLKNPKRYLRIQKIAQDGSRMSIDLFVGNLDGLTGAGSVMQIQPVAGYWLRHLDEESRVETLKILAQYYLNVAASRAMNAGLSLPSRILKRGGLDGQG